MSLHLLLAKSFLTFFFLFFFLFFFFEFSYLLMTLTVFNNFDQVVCRMFYSWDSSDIFPMIGVELWNLEKITEVKCHFHHITLRIDTIRWFTPVGVNLGHLVETLFARFLHCKVTLYSAISILYPLEGSHYT